MSIYKFSDAAITVTLQLDGGITIITGDSATGKTFFLNRLKMAIKERSLREFVKTNYDLDKTYVCLDRDSIDKMYNREKNLIFIDRFDTIALDDKTYKVNRQLIDFINDSDNIFVIMTRGSIEGIMCRFTDIKKLKNEVTDNTIKIYTTM
ncbi:MAG: hypothetical protein IJ593_10690 [Lachnospiraceae bacterium]|nr:hypothetical protein [Lachnospiraceae bacterium]